MENVSKLITRPQSLRISQEQIFWIWVIYIIGGLVCLSLDPIIILIYFFIIILSIAYRKYFSEVVLVFFVSFIFLYPRPATKLSHFNSKAILLGIICVVFYVIYRRKIKYFLRRNKTLKKIIISWLTWGSIAYSILLVVYLLYENSGINIMEYFHFPPPKTSHIRIFVNTIPLVFLSIAPILSLKKNENFKKLLILYVVLLSINVLFGLLEYFYGVRIVDESYTLGFRDNTYGEKRLFSFSYTDPLGFGRMISFPVLLLISYLLLAHKRRKVVFVVILSLGVSALLLTFGRTTYISTIAGCCAIFFLHKKNAKLLIKYSIIIFIFIAIIFVTAIPSYFSTVARLVNPLDTLETRLYKRQMIAFYFIKTNPLFGTFPGQMIELSKTMGPLEIDRSAHSLYLQTGVDFGIPMILIISYVLIYSFWTGRFLLKKYKNILLLKKNIYITVFLITCSAHSISMMIHGIVENVPFEFIFLNLGYIIAAKNILKNSN